MTRVKTTVLALLLNLGLLSNVANAADLDPKERDSLVRIRDAAMQSDWGYQRLADLSDLIGARLAGSPGAEAAVTQVSQALETAGISTHLEPVKVPHWVRGVEEARLIDYPGKPAGVTQKIVLTALGSSVATPPDGIDASVLVVRNFMELEQLKDQVKGRIVLFDEPFDHNLADNNYSGTAYGYAGRYRFQGPARAAKLGAVAVLVRSVGSADFRLPHTGDTHFEKGQTAVPAAAVSVEDALLIERLSQRGGPVVMHLTLTPQILPDVDSHNVIGEIAGSDANAGIVVVSGHLDAWDLGTGAMDDGIGVTSAMAALQVIQQLGLKPRRTIRFVAWMNEENGLRGATAYAHDHHDELARHVAAIESDFGIGAPLGITTNAAGAGLAELTEVLAPIGTNAFESKASGMGSDLDGIENAGVPIYEPLADGRHYFDYHHTAADTFDKIDPLAFRKQVAVMAVLAYFLADRDPELPRQQLPLGNR